MKAFPELRPMQLEWMQPRTFERYFELRQGDDLLATLSWERLLSTRAIAETAHGDWSLEQPGILNQRVDVHEESTGRPVASFYPKLTGRGVLEFVDGRSLEWEPTNFWGTNWSFYGDSDSPLMAVEEGVQGARWRDMLKTQFTVTVDRAGCKAEELALLAALGLYLIVLRQEATAGAVAASTAVV
jgi:hypothetical protein